MINLRPGDVLVTSSKEYQVIAVNVWDAPHMSQKSFARLATVTATAKRATTVAGKRSPATTIAGLTLTCTPIDPRQTMPGHNEMDTPYTGLETFASDGSEFIQISLERLDE